jgi:penicillin-binding protein 1A
MKSFLKQLLHIWSSVQTAGFGLLNTAWQFVDSIAVKSLGEARVNAFYDFINNFRKRYKAFYDKYIGYNARVARLYKYVWRSFLVAVVYWFVLETNLFWLTGEMPSVSDLENPKLSVASEIYSSDGVLIGKFFLENRTPVKDIRQISPHLQNALIATEDLRFYEHSGIDYKAWAGVLKGILTGGERGGGSTITQQLAKNLFNTRKKQGFSKKGLLGYVPFLKTFIYKTKEWLTAIKLEKRYTKDEIMLWYLNTVDFGSNSYGIKVAAKTYFNTSPDSLAIQEAAVLVGLQKATTTYNPKLNYDKSMKRRNTVLSRMVKSGYLKENQADSLSKLPIVLDGVEESAYDGTGNYFKTAINKMLSAWADSTENDLDLYRDGLKIHTTIDSRMQAHAEDAVYEGMKNLQKTFDNHWLGKNPWADEDGNEIPGFIDTVAKRTEYYKVLAKKFAQKSPDSIAYYMNKPRQMRVFSWKSASGDEVRTMSAMDSIRYYKHLLQAGMMTMNPFTGHIKAWVGGLDYRFFKYDHVKQGRRQPGSTFKPIVYCAAIDGPKNMSPCDQIKDEPFKIEVEENGEKKVWEPRNADRRFSYSNLTLRKAMARSVNSVAARLTDQVGADTVVHYARKLGIKSPLQAVPSIGLGSFDVSLYEMVAAYCVFINHGRYTEPLLVSHIEDRNGNLIKEFSNEAKQVIREESAFLMRYMLQGGMQESGGTSQNLWSFPALFPDYKAEYGGKTGTTSNHSDGWFMGVTRDLVTGVWVGGDDRSIHFRTGAYGEGSKTALPLYGRYMTKIFQDKGLGFEPGPFPKPGFKVMKDYDKCANNYTPVATDSTSVATDSLGNPVTPINPDATAESDSTGTGQ